MSFFGGSRSGSGGCGGSRLFGLNNWLCNDNSSFFSLNCSFGNLSLHGGSLSCINSNFFFFFFFDNYNMFFNMSMILLD